MSKAEVTVLDDFSTPISKESLDLIQTIVNFSIKRAEDTRHTSLPIPLREFFIKTYILLGEVEAYKERHYGQSSQLP